MTEMTITRTAYPMAWQESPRRTKPQAEALSPAAVSLAVTPAAEAVGLAVMPAAEAGGPAAEVQEEPAGKRRRAAGVVGAAMAAVIAVAAVFGPGPALITRLGAGEQVAFATVSAADTIRSNGFLSEVPAAGRRTS
ncbi:hypothetical protein [Actinoplanes sp. NPDC051494]|uniref:hypothetical protein n=1 Tax=Actinoplanes sp. NPDC051494 TaxID=3363907 RepID=UPI0037A58CD0